MGFKKGDVRFLLGAGAVLRPYLGERSASFPKYDWKIDWKNGTSLENAGTDADVNLLQRIDSFWRFRCYFSETMSNEKAADSIWNASLLQKTDRLALLQHVGDSCRENDFC